jgi:hypothetical protein
VLADRVVQQTHGRKGTESGASRLQSCLRARSRANS